MVEQQEATRKRPGFARSPSYPGIDLEEAIGKARAVYEHERRNAAPIATIVQHWGYRSESGPALVAVAALKKFGLLVDEGSGKARRARLSSDAIRILTDDREDSTERDRLLQEAALRPGIHRELWERYDGDLPSDSSLRYTLLHEYSFTENGARDFIRQLRDTLAYAGLTGGATLATSEEDKTPRTEPATMPPTTPVPATIPTVNTAPPATSGYEIQIPVWPNEWATLKASFPLEEAKWDQMLAVLSAMKPALVVPAAKPSTSTEQPAPARAEAPVVPEGPPSSLTAEVRHLIDGMGNGSVPAFITSNLRRIAEENGVAVSEDSTPNQVIEELRRKAQG